MWLHPVITQLRSCQIPLLLLFMLWVMGSWVAIGMIFPFGSLLVKTIITVILIAMILHRMNFYFVRNIENRILIVYRAVIKLPIFLNIVHKYRSMRGYKSATLRCSVLVIVMAIIISVSMWFYQLTDYLKAISQTHLILDRYQEFIVTHADITLPSVSSFLVELAQLKDQTAATITQRFIANHFLAVPHFADKTQAKFNALMTDSLHDLSVYTIAKVLPNKILQQQTASVYALFKAYLMMGNPAHCSTAYLSRVLVTTVDLPIQTLSVLLDSGICKNVVLNPSLLQTARQYLASVNPAQLILLSLQYSDSHMMQMPAFPVINRTNQWLTLNASDNKISMLYTTHQRETVLTQEIPQMIAQSGELTELLAQPVQYENAPALPDEVVRLYLAAYRDAWITLLSHVKRTVPQSLSAAQKLLQDILSPQSSLLSFIKVLHQETNFPELNQLAISLAGLNSLLDHRQQPATALQKVLTQLAALNDQLLIIVDAPNPLQAAFTFSQNILKTHHQTTATQLIDTDLLQEPARTWFNELSNTIWMLLLQESIGYLQKS